MKKISTLLAAAACVLGLQAQTVTVSPHDNVCDVTVDGTTYNDVAVTTVGDIHLVALNRDGVSLLVRYTDANTVAANGTVNGQPVNYASDAVAAYAQTFQIPNSDFEQWHSVGNNLYEPGAEGTLYSWHGFGTCFGDYSGTARTISKLTYEDHNGGKCAVVSCTDLWIAKANGTLTTGRLKAGSMTATSYDNHSEMDMNANYSSDENDKYAKYGPFFVQLYAKPDSIKSSIKVALKNNSHKASFSAAITDGSYYQEPIPDGTTYTNVAASAKNEALPTQDWTDYTFPFTYNAGVDAKAIMVTISTNAQPGTGTGGDKVYVDDVELIYNAGINNIALNGVTLEGFNFDAATKTYDLSYSGQALNLTAENFDVTTEGQSAMVVKNVENLGYGNYRVAIGVTGPDFKNYALYTINVTRNPLTGKAYVMGTVNGNTWAANVGYEMTAGENNVYTARITTTGSADGYDYFSFTTQLANDADGWDGIKGFRTGAESADLLIDDSNLGTALSLTDWGIYNSFKIAAGEWDLTLDLNNKTLTVSKVFNPITGKVYILGEVNGNAWAPNVGYEMSTEDEKVYTAEVTTAGNKSFYYFSFTTQLAENDDQGGWNYILPYRFGAFGDTDMPDYLITGNALNTPLNLGEFGKTRAYGLEAGKWNFTLDMEARTLTVTKKPALRGDVNNDGSVDVGDVNILVNILLGLDSASNYTGDANVDGEGGIDVGDVNAIINIMLGHQ